jgi:uncharacterized membrane protein (DUF4010 family)
MSVAAASAVVATLLLGYKPVLHHWVGVLKSKELRAGIKLLLISVVLLPVLPNQGYGPWQALNPYAIWWMVVLIATISFAGYFAIKIGGEQRGVVFTGLFSGLASSTALTLHFSRVARQHPESAPILAAGILLACGTMIPRMMLLVGILNPQLLVPILVPAMVMASLAYLPGFWYLWAQRSYEGGSKSPLKNPLEMKTALGFGAVLALVMLLGKALKAWFGDAGVYALSAASGVTDVDAITLSLVRMTQEDLAIRTAVLGIVIAGSVNNIAKGTMAVALGGSTLLLRVGIPLLLSGLGGLLAVWLWTPTWP